MKKDNIKLSIFWIFSFLVIIFMMTFTTHAETEVPYDGSLPYKIEYVDDLNSWTRYNDLGNSILSSIDNYGLPLYDDDYVLILTDFGFYNDESTYHIYRAWFCLLPIEEFTSSTSNIFTNQASFNVSSSQTKYYFGVHFDVYGGFTPIVFNVDSNPTFTSTLFGHQSVSANIVPNNDPFIVTSHVPFYFNKNFYYNNGLVLEYEPISPIGVGVAIIPPGGITPDYPPGITAPDIVPPVYTSTDYTWTTPPTFDSSSIENAIGSIQNTLGWIANNLKEEFKNLTNNLKGFFKYIGETIQYYGNAILETLNNFIQNFYDNMAALVQPIFEKIDYITTPLEASVIWDNISTTSLVTNVNTIKTSLTSFQSAFTGVNEPSSYTIPIHLENLPSNWFGIQTTQYIDLGIINGTVKDGLRLFVWAMVTYGLVVTIFDSIANYINGGGDES